jgi:hypothetical protein
LREKFVGEILKNEEAIIAGTGFGFAGSGGS